MESLTNNPIPDFVKTTSALADELGVSRQSIHTWSRRDDAPKRIGGFWSVIEWRCYMQTHGLAPNQPVSRITAVGEVCEVVLAALPAHVSRHRIEVLKMHIKRALHSVLPGTRFRSETYNHATLKNAVYRPNTEEQKTRK